MTIERLFKCMGLGDGVNQEGQSPVDGRDGSKALTQLSKLVVSWLGLHKCSGVLLTCPVLLSGVCCDCAFVVCSHCRGELVTVEMFRWLWFGGRVVLERTESSGWQEWWCNLEAYLSPVYLFVTTATFIV